MSSAEIKNHFVMSLFNRRSIADHLVTGKWERPFTTDVLKKLAKATSPFSDLHNNLLNLTLIALDFQPVFLLHLKM